MVLKTKLSLFKIIKNKDYSKPTRANNTYGFGKKPRKPKTKNNQKTT